MYLVTKKTINSTKRFLYIIAMWLDACVLIVAFNASAHKTLIAYITIVQHNELPVHTKN